MQNLDQIRAAKALDAAAHTSRQAVSKLPAMIIQNGLLAAAAFASEKSGTVQPKREKMKNAMDAAAQHLKNPVHGLTVLAGCADADMLIQRLTKGHGSETATSLHLQRATSETLAFLSFLKRFTTKEEKES